jgi:hypothetical protein
MPRGASETILATSPAEGVSVCGQPGGVSSQADVSAHDSEAKRFLLHTAPAVCTSLIDLASRMPTCAEVMSDRMRTRSTASRFQRNCRYTDRTRWGGAPRVFIWRARVKREGRCVSHAQLRQWRQRLGPALQRPHGCSATLVLFSACCEPIKGVTRARLGAWQAHTTQSRCSPGDTSSCAREGQSSPHACARTSSPRR